MSRRPARIVDFAIVLSACVAMFVALTPLSAASARHGGASRLGPDVASGLVADFDTFLGDKDLEAFHRAVLSRYTEETLTRLARSGSLQARRAAFLALGLTGTFKVNAAVARGLRDEDPMVRNLAQNTLWAIWFRADTPENNAVLLEVRNLVGRERFGDAVALATRLIARSPDFAEAYNQRAIALFSEERFAESALDCNRALQRNPYHIGALSGLGQCYLRLDRRADALATFRRALTIQPYSQGLRETVAALEADAG